MTSYNEPSCLNCLEPAEASIMTHAVSTRPASPTPLSGIATTLWVAALVHSCVAGIVATNPPPGQLPFWYPLALALLIASEVAAFAFVARQPAHHWPLLLPVLLLKAGGVLVAIAGYALGWFELPIAVSTSLFDLFWIAVLVRLLAAIKKEESPGLPVIPLTEALATAHDQEGRTLLDLSQDAPLLVVFLRHFGCTFCRQALADLSQQRPQIEALGMSIALVHMGTEDEARFMLEKYGLAKIHHVSDPLRRLYRAFHLKRGTWMQLLGPAVWMKGFRSGFSEGNGVGAVREDSFQMPGVFIINDGQIVKEFRHQSAADRPDYRKLAMGLK